MVAASAMRHAAAPLMSQVPRPAYRRENTIPGYAIRSVATSSSIVRSTSGSAVQVDPEGTVSRWTLKSTRGLPRSARTLTQPCPSSRTLTRIPAAVSRDVK